jgi:hypothetical protein
VTTIIERTPATRATVVKTSLLYLAFTTAWVYGFANGQHDLPGIIVLAFFLLPLGVNYLLGFALARQDACALLAYAPVLALVGPASPPRSSCRSPCSRSSPGRPRPSRHVRPPADGAARGRGPLVLGSAPPHGDDLGRHRHGDLGRRP